MIDVISRFPLRDLTDRWKYGSRGAVKYVAIHHTVTLYLSPNATVEDELAQLAVIYQYHLSLGWGGIGYHAIGFPSGRWYLTAPLDRIGANVYRHNHEVHGVALAGDFTARVPGLPQRTGAAEFAVMSWKWVGIVRQLRPHKSWGGTSCPGATWYRWGPGLTALAVEIKEDRMASSEYNSLNARITRVLELQDAKRNYRQRVARLCGLTVKLLSIHSKSSALSAIDAVIVDAKDLKKRVNSGGKTIP